MLSKCRRETVVLGCPVMVWLSARLPGPQAPELLSFFNEEFEAINHNS